MIKTQENRVIKDVVVVGNTTGFEINFVKTQNGKVLWSREKTPANFVLDMGVMDSTQGMWEMSGLSIPTIEITYDPSEGYPGQMSTAYITVSGIQYGRTSRFNGKVEIMIDGSVKKTYSTYSNYNTTPVTYRTTLDDYITDASGSAEERYTLNIMVVLSEY